MIKEGKKIFMGYLNSRGNGKPEQVSHVDTCRRPCRGEETVKQKRQELAQGAGFNMPVTTLLLSRVSLKEEWWHFQPSSLWFQGDQSLPRNLTGKGSPSKEHGSFGLDK